MLLVLCNHVTWSQHKTEPHVSEFTGRVRMVSSVIKVLLLLIAQDHQISIVVEFLEHILVNDINIPTALLHISPGPGKKLTIVLFSEGPCGMVCSVPELRIVELPVERFPDLLDYLVGSVGRSGNVRFQVEASVLVYVGVGG